MTVFFHSVVRFEPSTVDSPAGEATKSDGSVISLLPEPVRRTD